jgi:hypothetical protein
LDPTWSSRRSRMPRARSKHLHGAPLSSSGRVERTTVSTCPRMKRDSPLVLHRTSVPAPPVLREWVRHVARLGLEPRQLLDADIDHGMIAQLTLITDEDLAGATAEAQAQARVDHRWIRRFGHPLRGRTGLRAMGAVRGRAVRLAGRGCSALRPPGHGRGARSNGLADGGVLRTIRVGRLMAGRRPPERGTAMQAGLLRCVVLSSGARSGRRTTPGDRHAAGAWVCSRSRGFASIGRLRRSPTDTRRRPSSASRSNGRIQGGSAMQTWRSLSHEKPSGQWRYPHSGPCTDADRRWPTHRGLRPRDDRHHSRRSGDWLGSPESAGCADARSARFGLSLPTSPVLAPELADSLRSPRTRARTRAGPLEGASTVRSALSRSQQVDGTAAAAS